MINLTLKPAFLLINVILFVFISQAQSIEGTIKDSYTNKAKPFVQVILKQNGEIFKSSLTDDDGYFYFENIKNGEYSLVLSALGAEKEINEVIIFNNNLAYSLDFDDTHTTKVIDVVHYTDLLLKENIKTISSDILKNSKPKVITDVLATTVGAIETNEGISFKGARPGTAVYYIDGIRTYGDLYIPMSAVKHIEIYTGGVPAQYGNSTSGVIVVETKSYFDTF